MFELIKTILGFAAVFAYEKPWLTAALFFGGGAATVSIFYVGWMLLVIFAMNGD